MPGSTTELSLQTAVDSDDNADYLTISLANSLRTVDALFNSATGHTHAGAHQGGAIGAAAIAPGTITSAMIADGTIAAADMAAGAAAGNIGALGGGLTGTLPNPTQSMQYAASVAAAPQGVATTSYIVINWSGGGTSRGGCWSAGNPTVFYAPVGGYYLATVIIGLTASGAGSQRQLAIMKNGAAPGVFMAGPFNASAISIINLSYVMPMSAGEYVQFAAWQDSGSALNVTTIAMAQWMFLGA